MANELFCVEDFFIMKTHTPIIVRIYVAWPSFILA